MESRHIDSLNGNVNGDKISIIIYKTPEYVLKSKRKYYKKKSEDPEFVARERERIRKYREENKEHIKELARNRKKKQSGNAEKIGKSGSKEDKKDNVVVVNNDLALVGKLEEVKL